MTIQAQPRTDRRSFWAWGLFERDQPTEEQRTQHAKELSERLGQPVELPRLPRVDDLELRDPRVKVPGALASFCTTDAYERAYHSYGADRGKAIFREFPNPPDVVAHPTTEAELEAVMEWASDAGYATIPYGGGSSVVEGVTPPEGWPGIVTIDMDRFDRVLEIDETSRAARIQAGVFGPALEDQLRPHGYTLRHFPQSFTGSTLGGWIATRSGGHYATNHTHIDDFVESTRMLTPRGWWESRRLPGSGAGPSPDRMVIGSEGILGIISEAWMRIQVRPKFRATAGVTFPSWESSYEGTRKIVQAKLWPANLRLLDPDLARDGAGMDGTRALLIVGFESAEVPQAPFIRAAVNLAREAGGEIADEEIVVDNGDGKPTGRQGAVGAWRDTFIPKTTGLAAGLGMVSGTFETAITWDRWPEFDRTVRAEVQAALDEVCGGGTLNCRFTHVYPDGPAPYYTYAGMYRPGRSEQRQAAIKHAASEAILKAGGTITHHHAVGRQHRPWYDRQRPDLFADALRAAKLAVDPNGVLNPGVLIDP
ncbi:MAG: FAD-binding protein [Dehalococcoidia bacterium]|nr:FAD-binding protein [Dehalococcoidia bacterium]